MVGYEIYLFFFISITKDQALLILNSFNREMCFQFTINLNNIPETSQMIFIFFLLKQRGAFQKWLSVGPQRWAYNNLRPLDRVHTSLQVHDSIWCIILNMVEVVGEGENYSFNKIKCGLGLCVKQCGEVVIKIFQCFECHPMYCIIIKCKIWF